MKEEGLKHQRIQKVAFPEKMQISFIFVPLAAPLIVHNLLINHLNLKKRVNTEGVAHRCSVAVLKNQKQPLVDASKNRCS